MNMKVVEYRLLSKNDEPDKAYRAWSRAYEYPKVLRDLTCLSLPETTSVHNTACGNEPIHLKFAKNLTAIFPHTTHSDLFPAVSLQRYMVNNLISRWSGVQFDVVICISTIEHLPKDKRLFALRQLCAQLAPGGHLFLTFDWPRVVNSQVEKFFNRKIQDVPVRLNGANSIIPDRRYRGLNIIYLHAQRGK